MSKKFAALKKKIVDSTPQIVATALSAAAATAYVLYLQGEKKDRFPAGERTTFTLHQDDIDLMTEEDAYPIFSVNGHSFQINYQPVDA
jgi:hypothetical protein